MVNYYKALEISTEATTAQVKSAYRRLARKKHPDLNKGSKLMAREFAVINDAYRVLVDPKARANYDRQRLKTWFSKQDSVFDSDNVHARRARQMAYERRYNAIIDRMIDEERKESLALQRIIFPVVALFISTGFVAVFKPLFWENSPFVAKIAIVVFSIAGIAHFIKRLQEGLERYTHSPVSVHDSIFQEIEEESQRYSRLTAITFLLTGMILSLGIGLLIGNFLGMMNEAMNHKMFSQQFSLELLLFPPIVVLLIDGIHSMVSRFEY